MPSLFHTAILRGLETIHAQAGTTAEYQPKNGDPRTVRVTVLRDGERHQEGQHHQYDERVVRLWSFRTSRNEDGDVVQWGIDDPVLGDELRLDGVSLGLQSIESDRENGHVTTWVAMRLTRHGTNGAGL